MISDSDQPTKRFSRSIDSHPYALPRNAALSVKLTGNGYNFMSILFPFTGV